jgi:cell division transport system ATP-binding protein
MHLLDEINAAGTTVVVVTHNQKIVDEMQKRVIRMEMGSIVVDEEESGYHEN